MTNETLYLGDNPLIASSAAVQGDYVTRDGESYYRIANVDGMDDFFISVVSDSNHWMFISTRGGLSAGRTDCDSALFPYYTEDKFGIIRIIRVAERSSLPNKTAKGSCGSLSLDRTRVSIALLGTSTRMCWVTSLFSRKSITI